jgi:hypothetical protein
MPEYESAFVNFLLSLAAHRSAESARRSDQGTSEQGEREGSRETSTLSGTVSPRASPGAQSEVSIGKEGHIGHSPLREPTHALPPRHEGFGTIHSRPHTMSGSAQILPDSTLVDGLNAQ